MRVWIRKPRNYLCIYLQSRKGGTVKNMISIRKRPAIVETRNRVGDWESDSVQFSGQKGILSVQVERRTRQSVLTKQD